MSEQAHTKAAQLLGGAPPGAAKSNDAAGQITHAPQLRACRFPTAGPYLPIVVSESTRTGEQHADGVVRHFLDGVVRHIRDPDTAPGGLIDGDVVQSDPQPRDDTQGPRGGDRGRADRRPVGHDRGGLMLRSKSRDHVHGRGFGGPGNEAETRILDEPCLEGVIGPRIIRE